VRRTSAPARRRPESAERRMEMRGGNLPPAFATVRRNLSHKELPRVFTRRENLMRFAAPQLKRADLPRPDARPTSERARDSLLVVVNSLPITDSVQQRTNERERERAPRMQRVESVQNNIRHGTTALRRSVEHKERFPPPSLSLFLSLSIVSSVHQGAATRLTAF